MKPTRSLLAFLFGSVFLTAQMAQAATYYWDDDAITAGFGTAGVNTGTWAGPTAGPTAGWSLSGTGANAFTAFTTATTDILNFGNGATGLGAGTITVSGTVDAGNMTFATGSGSILLSGGTINLAAAQTTTVNNATNTISSTLTGAGTSFTKAGTGILVLSGANSYTGTTIVNGGTLQVGDGTTGSLNGTTGTALTFTDTGTFNVQEAAGVSQGMGALSFSAGDGTITSTWNNGVGFADTTLTFASLAARSAGATANFTLAGTGSTATNNKIVLTSTTNAPLNNSGSNDRGIFFGGSEYARYDTTTGNFRAVIYGTDTNASALVSGATIGATTIATDIKLNGAITGQTTASVNTINLGGANNFTFSNAANILSVNGILATAGATIANTTTVSTIRAGASGGELVIRVDGSSNTLGIQPIIGNNGGSSLTKSGAGTLNIVNLNTYAGTTTINGGTLQIGGAGNLTAGTYNQAITIRQGANLTWASSAAQTLSGNITGAGSVTLNNASAVLTLSGASNTYSGGFTLTSGQVANIQGATYNGFGTGLLTFNGGQLRGINTSSTTIIPNNIQWNASTVGFGRASGGNPTWALNGNVTLGGNVATTQIAATEIVQLIFNGNISDGGSGYSFNFASGVNSVTFNGQNTFSGNITQSAGSVTIGGSGYLNGGNYAGVITTSGAFNYSSTATQSLSGSTANAISGLTTVSSGTLFLNKSSGNAINTGGLTIGQANDTAALVRYTGSTGDQVASGGTLTILGRGIFDFNGNTDTAFNSGLSINATGATGVVDPTPIINTAGGGAYTINGVFNITPANVSGMITKINLNGASLAWGNSGNILTASSAGRVQFNDGSLNGTGRTYTVGLGTGATYDLDLNLAITNTGTHGLAGGGRMQLSGSTSNTVPATSVTAGTLLLNKSGSAQAVGGTLAIGAANNTAATVQYVGASTDMMGTGAVTINGRGILDFNGATDTIGNVAIVSTGATGSNPTPIINTAGNGNLTIGTLAITPVAGFDSVINAGTSGTITLGGDVTFTAATTGRAQITGSTLALGGATRTFNIGLGTGADQDLLINAGISGSGVGLVKSGTGRMTLSGTNTYNGTTSVTAGTLTATKAAALPGYNTAGGVIFNGGTVGAQVGGAGWTTGQVDTLLANATKTGGALGIDTTNGDVTQWTPFTTNFGALGLAKLGTNSLVLNQANTFGGITTINAGTLQLAHASALSGGNAITFTGGTLQFTSSNTVDYASRIMGSTSAIALDTNGQSVTLAGNVNAGNTAGLTKTGAGTLTLSAANGFSGVTTVSAGTLALTNALALQNSALDTTSAGAVTLSGLTTLTLGGLSGATGNLASVISSGFTGTVTDLTLNTISGSVTYGGVIANGSMSLTKTGAGTQILSGSNTYTGLTTVRAGTLQIGNSSTGSLNGTTGTDLTFAATGTFNVQEAAGVSQGMGALTFSGGDGTVTSTWNNGAGSGNTALTFASLTARTAGATGNFTLAGTGSTATNNRIALTSTTNAPLTTGSNNQGIFFGGSNYARYNTATNTFAAVAYGTDSNATTVATGATIGATTSASDINITGAITAQTAASVNTIRTGTAITQTGGSTLNVNGILTTAGVAIGTAGNNLQTTAAGGDMVFNSTSGTTTVAANIINNSGSTLTKSGTGGLTLTGTNTYAGGTFLNGGTLTTATNASLGAASSGITVNGDATWSVANVVYARSITINDGATLTMSGGSGADVTGALTGNGTYKVTSAVGYDFTNLNNTFTGVVDTSGWGNTWASLGDSSNPIIPGNSGGFGWTGVAKTFALRPFTLGGNGTILSSGSGALVIQQPLAITGAAGARTLTLSGSYTGTGNTFAGNIADGPGSVVSLTRGNAGTSWALSGTNTYSGATTNTWTGTGVALTFQGMQALSPNTSLNSTSTLGGGANAMGTFRFLDDAATPSSRSTVNVNINAGENADPAPASNQNQMYLFVGNNSTANGGNGSGTTSGSTIQLGNVNFTQSNAGNVKGAYLTLTGANGYKLQVADVNITRQAAHTGNWNAMLRADAPMTVTGTVRQATGGGVGSTSTLQLEGSAVGSLISGNVLNSADSTPRVMLLSKAGLGDWTLSGSNTYTGGTTITTGKLLFSGANSLPTTGTVAVGAAGHLSLADGTARNQTVSALTLTSLGSLSFDWTGNNAGDQLTSTADITPTAGSRFAVNLNRSGSPGGSVSLLTGGAGSTLSSSTFYLTNTTDYTATLSTTATTLSVGSYTSQTPLTTFYWAGNRLAAGAVAGVDNAWALSDGTKTNWSSTTTAYTATALTPGATANVIFSNSQVGKTQQSTVLGADVTVNSVTIDDSTAVTIAGANGAALTLMSTSSVAGTVGSPGSAISVTSNANAASTISSKVILGADQTWNVANAKTLTVSGVVSGDYSLTKGGTGNLVLSNPFTYTGTTTINAGVLALNSASSQLNGGKIAINDGGTLLVQSGGGQSVGITVGNNIELGGAGGARTLQIYQSNAKTVFTGAISVTASANTTLNLIAGNSPPAVGGNNTTLGERGNLTIPGAIPDGSNGVTLGLSVSMDSQTASGAYVNLSGQNTFTGPISVTYAKAAGGYLTIGGESFNTAGSNVRTNAVMGSGYLGGGNYTNTISLGANTILDYLSSANQILGGQISGAGQVLKEGTGTLILSGANNYTGITTAATGSLVARSGSALGSGGTANVSVSTGAALSYVATTDTALNIGGTLAINGGTGTTIGGSIGATATSSQINVTGNATSTAAAVKVNIYGNSFSAATDGTGTYTLVQGGGTNTLNNAVLSLGTVYNNTNFTVGALASTANNITVGITTATPLTGNTYYVGGLSGASNVWAASNGSTRSNFATSSGGTAQALVPGAAADVIVDTNSNATSTVLGSDMAINSLTISDTSKGLGLNADGYKLTIGTGGITMSASVPASTIAANVGLGGNQTWTNNSANTLTVSGQISGTATLDKNGSGTLRVSGANTYTGATTINQGKLLVNNTTGSGTGTAAVSVAAAATLGGTGAISGAVNVTGQLSPGASIETLGTGALSLLNGSTLVQELDSSVGTGVGSDLLKVAGNLDLVGAVGLTLDDLAATDVAFVDNDVFSLINYTGTWNNGMFTFSGNELSDEEVFTFGLNTWKISYDDATGGLNYSGEFAGGADSFVNLTVVSTIPEPGAVFLGSMGLLLILRRRR